MLKKYKMGFDIWGLVVFLIIMIPNFIWFAVPAPNDILRTESVTKVIDAIGSIAQVAMIFALCAFINNERNKLSFTKNIITMICCIVIYDCSWVFYYLGVTNGLVILGLTIPPCMAFLFFAIDRKNYISVIPIVIFSVCHMVFGVANFII